MAKFEIDKNYNILYLLGLGVLTVLLIDTIVKEKKRQAKKESGDVTPISDAIAAIKTGQVSVRQIPDTI